MNPEIKKFWETQAWEIRIIAGFQAAYLVKDDGKLFTLASWRYLPINYFYQGSFISEKKMLRLVNLKAFL